MTKETEKKEVLGDVFEINNGIIGVGRDVLFLVVDKCFFLGELPNDYTTRLRPYQNTPSPLFSRKYF
jgi:hypothetical protein